MSDAQPSNAAETGGTQPSAGTPAPAPTPAPPGPQAQAALRQLMEKDRAFRAREVALKQQEARMAELEALAKELDTPEGYVKQMQKRGYSLDALQKLAGGHTDVVAPVMSKVSALEAELAALRQEREENSRRAAMEEERARMAESLNAKDYPRVKRAKAEGIVFEYVLQHYQNTGEVLDTDAAAKHVESQLEELAKQLAGDQTPPSMGGVPEFNDEPSTISNRLESEVTRQSELEPDPIRWNQEAVAMMRRGVKHG